VVSVNSIEYGTLAIEVEVWLDFDLGRGLFFFCQRSSLSAKDRQNIKRLACHQARRTKHVPLTYTYNPPNGAPMHPPRLEMAHRT
jgi:hypothetical protein